MTWKWRVSALFIAACAVGVLVPRSGAVADPNSAFFSQQLYDQQAEQQQGPWPNSQVNIPQLLSQGGSVNLSAMTAGQGGVSAGGGALSQALDAALPVATGVLGVSGTGSLRSGGVAGFSPGQTATSATMDALGALSNLKVP